MTTIDRPLDRSAERVPPRVPDREADDRADRHPLTWPYETAVLVLIGVATALVMLGPALAPGPLFTMDLVLPSHVPVPNGVWGLGPELPRRVPMWLPVAWLSPLIGGDTVGKLLMVASIAGAFVGAARLAMRATADPDGPGDPDGRDGPDETGASSLGRPLLVGLASGWLYALSPFLLTRLAVGHLMITLPMAVLPWVLPRLLRPGDDVRRTFLAVFALAFAGHYGGALACLIVGAGLIATRGRRLPAVIGVTALAQAPWLVPGLIVYLQGASIVDAAPFATQADGPMGIASVLAGHGFWQPRYQVGAPGGAPAALAGVVLLGLAIAGARQLPAVVRRPMAILAGVGLVGALASALPVVSDLYVTLSRNVVLSIMREGHRLLPLYLLWMAPAAALGARRVGQALLRWTPANRSTPANRWQPSIQSQPSNGADVRMPARWRGALGAMVEVVPVVLAVLLASGAIWGIDPRLRPVSLPDEWAAARQLVTAEAGTVAALPWHQYLTLEVDGTRRVLNPLPLVLGGDVLVSSDPELRPDDRRERLDPRERTMEAIVGDLTSGTPVAERLARLGVRWVVLLHEVDWVAYGSLARDPGLERRLYGPSLEVYAVRGWKGPIVGSDGQPVAATSLVQPLWTAEASGPAVYARPGAPGWMRGGQAASITAEGLVQLPAGGGLIWYWPSVLAIGGAGLAYAAAALAALSTWTGPGRRPLRARRAPPHDEVKVSGRP